MMSYSELYKSIQARDVPLSRGFLRPEAVRLTASRGIKLWYASLDTRFIRGYFVSSHNTENRFVQKSSGLDVIVLHRELNDCWKRLVFTKELMHLFDTDNQRTQTPEQLQRQLSEMGGDRDPKDLSPQISAEYDALWMALGVLCPESIRQELETEKAKGLIDDYGIALRLKIPKEYAGKLFTPQYKNAISRILGFQVPPEDTTV